MKDMESLNVLWVLLVGRRIIFEHGLDCLGSRDVDASYLGNTEPCSWPILLLLPLSLERIHFRDDMLKIRHYELIRIEREYVLVQVLDVWFPFLPALCSCRLHEHGQFRIRLQWITVAIDA
jgi:hypothetical protein